MKSLADKNSCRRKMKAALCLSPAQRPLHVYIGTCTQASFRKVSVRKTSQACMFLPVSLPQSDLHSLSVVKLVPQASGCHGNRTGIPAPAASPVPQATHEISICTSGFVSKEENNFAHNFSRLWNKALENDANGAPIKCLHSALI